MKNKYFLGPIIIGITSFVIASFLLLKLGISYNDDTQTSSFYTYKVIKKRSKIKKDSIKKDTLIIDTIYFNNKIGLAYKAKSNIKYISPSNVFFNRNPKFLLWIFLIVTLFAISNSLILGLYDKIKLEIKSINKKEIYFLLFLSLVVSLSTYLLYLNAPNMLLPKDLMQEFGVLLNKPTFTIMILSLPTLFLAIMCVLGILAQGVNVEKIKIDRNNKEEAIDEFINIKNALNDYLGVLGLVVTSGIIITTSIYQRTFNDYFITNGSLELFPKDFVYLFGFLFSFAILITYVPVYLRIIKKGNKIISEINPIDLQNIEKWNKDNISYMNLLGVKIDTVEGVYTSIKIFAPMLTSIITSNLSL